jgi:hypothetical protein
MYTTVCNINISALTHLPELLAWVVGIILAIIMVRRGGLKAEKLFLAGCVLTLLSPLSGLFLQGWFVPALHDRDMALFELTRNWVWIVFNIIIALGSLAGLVCLVWAFLLKFWKKKQEVTR